jgi:putative thioredoxin
MPGPESPEATLLNSQSHPSIIEATAETFVAEVIERSETVPVLVDFWAEWCQPCRILGPTLEKLAVEFDGKFVLVKAETEKLQEIATGFGVRSIPAVFAVKGGHVVDSFVGVFPEAALRDWINKILPTPAETLVIEARALESTDLDLAELKLREAVELARNDPASKIALARVVLARGKVEEARAIIHELERRGFLEPEAETLKAELTLRGVSGQNGDLEVLKASHLANPNDNPTQLQLAEALASAGMYDQALPLALELVERDRKVTGESARKLMIAAFQLLPPDSDLANSYRRKLSVAL